MNEFQDVIDWLRSPEGSRWSEMHMREAVVHAQAVDPCSSEGWNLNLTDGHTIDSPLYLAGVLSVKEQDYPCG